MGGRSISVERRRLAALTTLAAGCAGSYRVSTITAPEAPFYALHTFRVLSPHVRRRPTGGAVA